MTISDDEIEELLAKETKLPISNQFKTIIRQLRARLKQAEATCEKLRKEIDWQQHIIDIRKEPT